MKIWFLCACLAVIFLFLSIGFLLVDENSERVERIVKCYDNNRNEIIGLQCKETFSFLKICSGFCFFSSIVCILFALSIYDLETR